MIDALYAGLRTAFNFARRRFGIWYRGSFYRRRFRSIPIAEGNGLDAGTRAAALAFLDGFVSGYRDLRWHEAYCRANGQPSAHYLPEDIFYALVMPVLNPRDRIEILKDKQHYDLLPGWPRRPVTIGRVMNGRLLDASFKPTTLLAMAALSQGLDEVVVKPSRVTSGGKNIRFCRPADLRSVLADYGDAVIQRPVIQHPALAALNPTSVNTVRAITYRRIDGEIVFISATVRMGRAGSRVDNRVAGGIAVALHADGSLGSVAFDRKFRRYETHPDHGMRFAGHKIPGPGALRAAAVAAHAQTPWLDFASWDLSIEGDGQPTVIEVNVGTSLNLPQLVNGPILAPVVDDMKKRIGHRRYLPILGFV